MKNYSKNTIKLYEKQNRKFWKQYGYNEWQEFLKLIDYPLKGRVVLDAGCGGGHEAMILHKKGARAYGLDKSAEFIKLAKKNFPEIVNNFFIGDIKKIPFKKNFFDLIICKNALHYAKLPNNAYKEFFRCLKNDGLLIFSVHHPFKAFFYKNKHSSGYFKKENIQVCILKKIKIVQSSHTFSEYLSEYFLKHFNLLDLIEKSVGHPKSDNKIPDYLLIKAKKKS